LILFLKKKRGRKKRIFPGCETAKLSRAAQQPATAPPEGQGAGEKKGAKRHGAAPPERNPGRRPPRPKGKGGANEYRDGARERETYRRPPRPKGKGGANTRAPGGRILYPEKGNVPATTPPEGQGGGERVQPERDAATFPAAGNSGKILLQQKNAAS